VGRLLGHQRHANRRPIRGSSDGLSALEGGEIAKRRANIEKAMDRFRRTMSKLFGNIGRGAQFRAGACLGVPSRNRRGRRPSASERSLATRRARAQKRRVDTLSYRSLDRACNSASAKLILVRTLAAGVQRASRQEHTIALAQRQTSGAAIAIALMGLVVFLTVFGHFTQSRLIASSRALALLVRCASRTPRS